MANRRWEILGLVALVCFFIAGCTALDKFFAYDPATGQRVPGGSPSGVVGGIANTWFPWAGTALTAIGGIYAAIRGRNWKQAATSTFTGLEAFFSTPEGAAIKAKAITMLAAKHDESKVRAFVDKALEGLKTNPVPAP